MQQQMMTMTRLLKPTHSPMIIESGIPPLSFSFWNKSQPCKSYWNYKTKLHSGILCILLSTMSIRINFVLPVLENIMTTTVLLVKRTLPFFLPPFIRKKNSELDSTCSIILFFLFKLHRVFESLFRGIYISQDTIVSWISKQNNQAMIKKYAVERWPQHFEEN